MSPASGRSEGVFGFLKSNNLASRLFDTAHDIREAVLDAWTKFARLPDGTASIRNREWVAPSN
ncbi:MAG: hypothetical protein OXN84_08610 [Albidovulum sp.]|nr:hypothetical protein [Albidovulum sp.]